jgi:hypothetical protein
MPPKAERGPARESTPGPMSAAYQAIFTPAGATVLVGRSLLKGVLADPSVQSVHVIGRRKPRVARARITFHIAELADGCRMRSFLHPTFFFLRTGQEHGSAGYPVEGIIRHNGE